MINTWTHNWYRSGHVDSKCVKNGSEANSHNMHFLQWSNKTQRLNYVHLACRVVVGSDYCDCVLHYGNMLLDSVWWNVDKCVYFTSFWAFTGQPCARRPCTVERSPLKAASKNASSITCTGYTEQPFHQVEPVREAPHHSVMICSASAAGTSHRCH